MTAMCMLIELGICDPESMLGARQSHRSYSRRSGVVAKLASSLKTGGLMSDHNGHQVMEKAMAQKNWP